MLVVVGDDPPCVTSSGRIWGDLSAFHCVELVETPWFSHCLNKEVQDLLLNEEVIGWSSYQLVSVTGDGVDRALDPSFPFVELVSVFQLVIVMVEEQVLLWCVLRMGSRW